MHIVALFTTIKHLTSNQQYIADMHRLEKRNHLVADVLAMEEHVSENA